MDDKNEQRLKKLFQSELKNAIEIKDRLANATRNWSPQRLLDEHIREEISARNAHIVSLRLIIKEMDDITNEEKEEAKR